MMECWAIIRARFSRTKKSIRREALQKSYFGLILVSTAFSMILETGATKALRFGMEVVLINRGIRMMPSLIQNTLRYKFIKKEVPVNIYTASMHKRLNAYANRLRLVLHIYPIALAGLAVYSGRGIIIYSCIKIQSLFTEVLH